MIRIEQAIHEIEKLISYSFTNRDLIIAALTHPSFAGSPISGVKDEPLKFSFERLEYLGDAVLQLGVSELLMQHYPLDKEGSLSQRRAALVQERSLAEVAKSLKLHEVLFMGSSEMKAQGNLRPRVLSCAFEALIGAVYLDSSYVKAFGLIKDLFTSLLEQQSDDFRDDWKTILQEQTQKELKALPQYRLETEEGPPHDKTFRVSIWFHGQKLIEATGKSKKAAEQKAAEQAVKQKLYLTALKPE